MRHQSFSSGMRAVVRAAARAQRAREREASQASAAAVHAVRAAAARGRADAKEAARLYTLSRSEQAESLTQEIHEREQKVERLLVNSLSAELPIDLLAGIKRFVPGTFLEERWTLREPDESKYAAAPQGAIARLLPGSVGRYARQQADCAQRFQIAQSAFEAERHERTKAWDEFQRSELEINAEIVAYNETIFAFERSLLAGQHDSVVKYFERVIDRSLNGEPDAESATIGFSTESRHLVVDLELPEVTVIPDELSFKYVKTADRIDSTLRSAAKSKALYSQLICQVVLKCVGTIFRADPKELIGCLTLNGMLDAVDPTTGNAVRVCLISLRVTADTFRSLNLAQVDPAQCLRSLKAAVSSAPTELLAVRPLIELDMVDPRFIATTDVMSGLDTRPNLMDLTPGEFESLITQLFSAMDHEVRQTQASRDGGVDCVAFDSRPVFGGKIVIQAKRYKGTVGVSAVRDLFGTVQNEGACKGILVTTSGYGKASYDFAKGKPLELLDGTNLLFLLKEKANIEAKIVMPEKWNDIVSHETPSKASSQSDQ